MVVVAQLVERWLVEPDVAGSSPVGHPNGTARLVRAVPRSSAGELSWQRARYRGAYGNVAVGGYRGRIPTRPAVGHDRVERSGQSHVVRVVRVPQLLRV